MKKFLKFVIKSIFFFMGVSTSYLLVYMSKVLTTDTMFTDYYLIGAFILIKGFDEISKYVTKFVDEKLFVEEEETKDVKKVKYTFDLKDINKKERDKITSIVNNTKADVVEVEVKVKNE